LFDGGLDAGARCFLRSHYEQDLAHVLRQRYRFIANQHGWRVEDDDSIPIATSDFSQDVLHPLAGDELGVQIVGLPCGYDSQIVDVGPQENVGDVDGVI
jgi:hypothetical protein